MNTLNTLWAIRYGRVHGMAWYCENMQRARGNIALETFDIQYILFGVEARWLLIYFNGFR